MTQITYCDENWLKTDNKENRSSYSVIVRVSVVLSRNWWTSLRGRFAAIVNNKVSWDFNKASLRFPRWKWKICRDQSRLTFSSRGFEMTAKAYLKHNLRRSIFIGRKNNKNVSRSKTGMITCHVVRFGNTIYFHLMRNCMIVRWGTQPTGKVENLHGHVNFNLQHVNIDLHSL